jgi:hypothetical protein
MANHRRILILSDIHYVGESERERGNFESEAIDPPLMRAWVRAWMHFVWERRPGPQNGLLEYFLSEAGEADLVIANGDYSADSAFVGVSDRAALDSAQTCLGKLRKKYADRFHGTIGDHELGKNGLGMTGGGMRLESFRLTQEALGLRPLWRVDLGLYTLLGVTSSLAALPIYASEILPDERDEWRRLSQTHLAEIEEAFHSLPSDRRVILFCHDPSALPFLHQLTAVREKLGQIEATIVGHLHSNLIFQTAGLTAGFPPIAFLGDAIHRMSRGLNQARIWKNFRTRFCPSLAGIHLLNDGGYYSVELDDEAAEPARFTWRAWKRDW